ncbi:MAG: YajQ family cyclic di-GMP-binding protein [bacterium]|nr:YajQ family cyclic di-GMP-binding protein [bacterium]
MPQYSFDVSTGVDLQEVDNASNQARKEIAQRYDFRGSKCTIEFERKAASLTIEGDDAFRVKTVIEVLREKLIKRKVPVRNLDMGEDEPAGAGRVRRKISLIQGIDSDTAKKIVKEVKAQKFKKAQVAIQGEELRVSSPAKDVLQEVITFLKSQDYGIELEFGNYR